MRKLLIVRLALFAALLLAGAGTHAQTITIDNANIQAGPYGQGSNVAVPIEVSGCFNTGNSFELYISDNDFASEQLVGTFNSYFTTFVNGTLPNGLTPGNYKFRVKSTSPAVTSAASTSAYSVVATGSPLVAQADAQLPSRVLQSQLYYGWCSGTAAGNTMTMVNQSTAGATVTSVLINEKTNAVTSPVFAAGNASISLARNYYTFIVVASNGSFKSTRAYNLINSPNRLGLSTDGEQNACLPDTLGFTIGIDPDAGGIGDNWPLHRYSINWGDGSPIEIFRHCELIASNGIIKHPYTQNSCGQPNVAFTVTTSLINHFYVSGGSGGTPTQQNCEQPVVQTRAKIFERPDASFSSDTIACVNVPITFTNNSYAGYAQLGPTCVQNADYFWFINGTLAQQTLGTATPPNFTHSFTSPGRYEVRLLVDNGSCATDVHFDTICVVPAPVPNFTMNGQPGNITGCSPIVITINNLTPTTDCSPTQYTWAILNNPSGTPANPANYTITPNANAQNPVITFTGSGSYIVRQTATNFCSGTFVLDRIVTIIATADATIPGNTNYCNVRTIHFGTNPSHTPTYNTNAGTETFLWSISPGSYTFVGGTSANSAYPQIQFNANTTYTVTVTFTNPCGTDQATQQITFFEPTTANAGVDQTVCYNATTINLNGNSSGPAGYSFNWSAVPGFGTDANISNTTIANPTYTLSPGDRSTGVVRLILSATPPAGSVCPVARDTIQIVIHPDNNITSAATRTICSGTNLNYTMTSSVAGSTFSWTSSVISGTATGNTAAGTTALISDVLTNTSNSVDAVVRYVITPVANGCNGNAFNLDVTVKPLPQFTPTPTATLLCSGEQLTINLASALAGPQYTWSSSVSGGTVTGNTNQASPTSTTSIVNTLTNTGTTDVTVTYTIIVYNPGSPICTGETEQVVVTVRPPVNASASSNSPVCSGQTINLTGNSTTGGATYAWTGPNGFNSTDQSPAITNAIPANAGVYTLIVTAGGCPSPPATTTVVVNSSAVVASASGTNPTNCATATGSITLTGLANNTVYTVNYTFNGNPATPVSLSSNGSGALVIPNLASGVYNNITVSLGSCPSNAVGPVTLSDPSAPNAPTAGSNSPICSGNTLNLTASTSSPGTATYAWSGPNGFSSNQPNPSITNATTAATGTYNVVVTINNCTSASGTVNVVVNATPVTPTTGSNSPICTGGTLNLTASTSTGGVTYAWTGPGGFTSAAQNPTINNVSVSDAGTYNVTATLGSCISAPGTTTVEINPTPNIGGTSTTNPTNCATATGSITLTGLANNTTYTVDYNFNGNPVPPLSLASSGTGTLVIPNLAAGIYDNIRVTLNGCVSNVVGPFTLSDPTPPATPTAASNSPVCSGLTLNLTASTTSPGTATYTWSGPNTFSSNQPNPSITNVTTAATGTYSVTVTINGCTSAAGTTTVTINPTPVTPVAASNSPVCSGADLNLTATTSTPGVITWAWNGPNAFASNQQNPTITAVTTAANGTYNVTATLGSCTSAAGTTTVVINPTPNISGGSVNNPANCATSTGSIVLSGLAVSTAYIVHYTQNGTPQTATISSNASGNLIIPNLPAGSYTNVSVELNNCPSNTVGPFTLSDPTPPAVPLTGSNGPICSGNTLQLTSNSATPGVTYAWNGPNGFSSTLQNPSIPNASVAANGIYSVTATLNSCTSAAGTVTVTVHATPVAPTAASNSPVCSGGTLNLTASTPSAGVTYAWTGPNGFSNSNQNPTITNVTTADAGVYTVIATATTGNCPSTPGTTTVVINPTPNIAGSTANNPTNCASSTGSITLTGLTPNTTYTVNYTQGATPQTATLLSDASGALVIPNLPAGNYSNISVTLNNCPSNIVGPFILSDPTPPATPTAGSNGPVCSGSTLNLTASTITPGTATYAWNGPNGFVSTDQNPSITNVTTAATGTYTVLVTINSCTSAAGTVNVVVHQTPATPVASSNTPVCSDSTLHLTASTTSPGAMTWSWNGPNGFTSIVQNPSITNITPAAAGTYSVVATATTGNCPSAPGNTTVVINPTPVITTTALSDPTNCNTPTGSITLNGLTAATTYTVLYNYNGNPQTASLTSNASGSLVIPNLLSGTYSNIRVVLANCPSNTVGPITLTDPNPPVTPVAGSNGPICSGNDLNLTASTTSVGAIVYTWSGPNAFSSTQQNPTIAAATLAANGVYSVTATLNGCVSGAGTVNVVVHETPATPTAGSNSPICADSTLNLTAVTTFGGAMTWSWTGPGGFTSSSQNPSIAGATIAAAGVYSVVATSTVGTCPSTPGTTTVVINPTPVISIAGFTNPTQCLSSTGTITLNGLSASTAYTVTYTVNGNPVSATITSDGSGVVTIPNLVAGTYASIRVTTLAGCPSNTVGPFILTDPNPPAQPTAGSNSPICMGETLNLTSNTTTPGAITYSWTGPAGFNSNLQNPSIINASAGNSGTYTVTATLNNCVSPPTSVLVEVTALPAAPAVSSPVTYCVNSPSVPLTATPAPGNTLRWYTTAVGGVGSATAPTPSTGTVGVTSYYVSQVTTLGCEGARALIEVVVNPDAFAEYVYSPSEDCAPFNINASVIQPIVHPLQNGAYQWYANGVFIGSGTTFPGYTITNPGDSVLIKLVTISLHGCKNDSAANWFYTPPVPQTNFTASDTVGCGPLTVAFTNTTPLMNEFSYNWNFGNGITSSAVNPGPITFYPNPTGQDTIYNVSLAAFTQCDTIIKVIPIRIKSKPQAIITPDKTYGCSPMTVTFSNTSLGVNMTYEWNFGDGSPSFFTNNNLPVQHTFNTGQQDTFYVQLIATNECGADTGYYNIVVAAATIDLDVAINGNQTTGCAPHTVTFFNHSTGATNFIWDFGDGNLLTTTANTDTITHIFQIPGTYNVYINASNGCTDTTITETIQVFERPTVNFTFAPSSVCVGDTIAFTNQSNMLTGMLWNFDDGTTSTLTNPVHAYSAAGTYNVQLIGIRQYAPGNACTDTISYPVTVVASLPGNFTANISGNCLPVTVTFTNQTLPSALTTWSFGNGDVDTGDIVTYTYTQVGSFTVVMTARDINGCVYTHQMQINTTGPNGSFIYDNGFICGSTPVRFEANTTNSDSIRWNFGDGTITTAVGSVIYHVYSQPGVYIPSATLLGGPGGTCTRLLTGTDTIKIDYVSAGFTANQVRTCGSTTVAFTDTSRSYFGVNGWQWNFGDGGTSTVQHPVHAFTTTNTWPIQLIATAASGCADTTVVPVFIKVDETPTASIVHDPVGCVNQPVIYNSVVISPDPITYYSWTFSNLSTGNTPNTTNNYAAPGVYTAQLIVGTAFGCYDTTTSSITINPSPFVVTNPDMQICRGESAHLNATGGLTYTWAPFTGLSCTTCPNPVASPLTTTQYVVTGYNGFGCAGRDTILITVPQPIEVIATPPVTLCIGQSVQLNATGANTYVWSPSTGLSATNIPNPVANPTVTTIYRVIGFDAHNCFQDTTYVPVAVGNYPVVNLGGDTVLSTGTQYTLTPTATNGPIALWTWTPSTDLSCSTCPAPVATAKKDICYTVTATNIYGCSGRDTMCIRVFCEGTQVFIPNAFTPDADGINDILTVKGKGIKTVKVFRIFNRWGQLVFERSNFSPNMDSHGWNGTVNGIPAPPDVYVYTCEVICEDDTPYVYKGNVAILK